MKIIKEGRDPKKWPKKVTCRKCGTEYEYDKSDCRWDESGEIRYVRCPICGERHTDYVDPY